MSVEDRHLIDQIVGNADLSEYCLVMTERRPFGDTDEQLVELMEKINTYVAYIQTGQVYLDYPAVQGKDLKVVLSCRDVPRDTRYQDLISAAAGLFAKHGARFEISILQLRMMSDDPASPDYPGDPDGE